MFVEDVSFGNDYIQMVKREILEAVWNEALKEKERYANARVIEEQSKIITKIRLRLSIPQTITRYSEEYAHWQDSLNSVKKILDELEKELKEVKQP
jgi:uncharacterized protein YqgQ